jgi:hypothetical protein
LTTAEQVKAIAVSAGTAALANRNGSISVEDAARLVLTAAIRSGAVHLYDDDAE